jgi:hypothetical protein
MNFDERRAPMKIVIGLLAAAILGTGGFAFAAGVDDTQPARTVSLPGTTTGATTAATTAATTTDDIVIGNAPAATTTNGVDISGPCDEAEHANDPRCTGTAAADDGDHDNSGSGSGDDNDRDDNSGHGSGHDNDDDNSGHGSGHDNNDDD